MSARHAVPPRAAPNVIGLHPGWLPVLERVPLFSALSKRHQRRIGKLAETKLYGKGAQVVREGAKGDAFYVILEGTADVLTRDGRTRKLSEGDYFGELALLDGFPRAATVQATSDLATARIGRSEFQKLLKDEPEIGVGLARGLLAIIRAQDAG